MERYCLLFTQSNDEPREKLRRFENRSHPFLCTHGHVILRDEWCFDMVAQIVSFTPSPGKETKWYVSLFQIFWRCVITIDRWKDPFYFVRFPFVIMDLKASKPKDLFCFCIPYPASTDDRRIFEKTEHLSIFQSNVHYRILIDWTWFLFKEIVFLLLVCIPILTNARLVPFRRGIDEPLTIDAISTNNIMRMPMLAAKDQAMKRQATPARANTTICYPVVGCFDNNDPFNNAAFEVPQSPDFVGTSFLLFTQESPNLAEFLSYGDTDEELINSSINPSRWLRIIIHGFTNNRDSTWIKPLRDELMKLTDVREEDSFLRSSLRASLGSSIGRIGDRLGSRSEVSCLYQCCIQYTSGGKRSGFIARPIGQTQRPFSQQSSLHRSVK